MLELFPVFVSRARFRVGFRLKGSGLSLGLRGLDLGSRIESSGRLHGVPCLGFGV